MIVTVNIFQKCPLQVYTPDSWIISDYIFFLYDNFNFKAFK